MVLAKKHRNNSQQIIEPIRRQREKGIYIFVNLKSHSIILPGANDNKHVDRLRNGSQQTTHQEYRKNSSDPAIALGNQTIQTFRGWL